MGNATGFIEIKRAKPRERPVHLRVLDWQEVYLPAAESEVRDQGARCMDCGIPFCHQGCPLGNQIPEWNDLVYRQRWQAASEWLHATNNFPDFTGRLRPAPCEGSCVLGLHDEAVTIKNIELSIVERAFAEGWIRARRPVRRTGKGVAIVGSGPAGLAAADQLNRAGHWVTVFERADRPGGLLRYGIPEFKLEKRVLDRRLALLADEGIVFETGVTIGEDISATELREHFDAIVLCCGAEWPRDLDVPGRELAGIHFAVDYLTQQNRRCEGDDVPEADIISAAGKRVVIIGGGDRGPTVLARFTGRGRLASISSSSCLAHRTHARATTPGPSGPACSARRRRTTRGATGSSRSPRSASWATSAAASEPWRPAGSRWCAIRRGPGSNGFPGRSSSCPRIWCCWRWDSSARTAGASCRSSGCG